MRYLKPPFAWQEVRGCPDNANLVFRGHPGTAGNRCLLEAGVQINQIVSEALGILESRLSTKSCADVAQFDAGFTL